MRIPKRAGQLKCLRLDQHANISRHPVRMRPLAPGAGPSAPRRRSPVIAPDVLELLARIAHQLAGSADVGKVLGELQR